MLEDLRTGAWLTRERLYAYPAILFVLFAAAALALLATSHGLIDAFGRPPGTDFSEIFTAGREVDQGHPGEPYHIAAFRSDQERIFGPSEDFYVWLYPPYFLALAAVFGRLPYLAALVLWQATTLSLYLATVLAALRPAKLPVRPVMVAAVAFPAVFINLLHGQNGFLTAALLGGGLALLERRPLLAGLCFALLAYKPQFAVLLVPALVAGGYWRAGCAAAVAFAGITLATLAWFGTSPWQGFLADLGFTRMVVEQGAVGFAKNESPFAAVRLLGGGSDLGYAAQGTVSFALLVSLVFAWRSAADFRLRASSLLAASLIATPQVFDYDMAILAPALAFAVSYGLDRGFGPFEKTGLALVWLVPLLARPLAGAALVPLGPIVVLLFFIGVVRRAWMQAKPTHSRVNASRPPQTAENHDDALPALEGDAAAHCQLPEKAPTLPDEKLTQANSHLSPTA
jgi:alpha-1,2-mannosyltransferase